MKASTPQEAKVELQEWYAKSAERAKAKAEKRRQLAINKFVANTKDIKVTNPGWSHSTYELEASIVSKIYNWFLNINITY